ncbi:hypothetical protein H634G_10819 [Metarhizium anisopliae BRIP 53293]|uniref:Uncharacterized protein n=1 Tax=Metarhizium anisopliae BRIP 53293 TaxID=1291518 RepID=A0A0D9NJJ2_METAN|nr:hypothetical protein H634G_10819 [Metarhizium anisopliae BRIP 53293]KJK87720.1 hypothetical protein H633G_08432 [Metarhizium anisopliae BRIP 53284]
MEELVHGTAEENPSMGQGLLRRLLPNPRQDKVGQYLEKQSEKPMLQPLCPFEAGGFDSPSFCYQTSFAAAELTKGQFLVGTARTELVGCTVLAVVSTRAVYICHFWEDIHYASRRHLRGAYGFQPVLNMIRGEGNTTYTAGPALDSSLFTGPDDHTRAFIMTPRNRSTVNDELSQQYPAEYKSLYVALGSTWIFCSFSLEQNINQDGPSSLSRKSS